MKRLLTGGLALAGFCLAATSPPLGAAPALSPAAPASDAQIAELDNAIKQSISTAHAAQEHERAIGALARDVADAEQGLADKQRALDEARVRAAAVLAALERFVHTPRTDALLAPQSPIDRLRGGMLMAAAVPALSTAAHQLVADIHRLSDLRTQAIAKQDSLARDRQGLAKNRERIQQLATKREELRRLLLREAADSDPRAVKQGTVAADLPDLITRSEAEADIRDREARARASKAKTAPAPDPTRPKTLRGFDGHAMVIPVAGPVRQRYGQTNELGAPSQGLTLASIASAEVVAPFDGRIDYVGPFRGYGLILIISHGGGYHSMLAGLGRVDVKIGEWVVAGEPIAMLPAPAKADESVTLYFELRRDGHPVDPQPSLADRGGSAADHRVNE